MSTGDDLTEREEEVAEMLVQGHSTREIAQSLWITMATVRNHIQRIMQKLGVHSRLAAVAAFRDRKKDPVGRVLAYCRRAGLRLTPLQESLIHSALTAERVQCEGANHVFPPQTAGEPLTCLCGAIQVATE